MSDIIKLRYSTAGFNNSANNIGLIAVPLPPLPKEFRWDPFPGAGCHIREILLQLRHDGSAYIRFQAQAADPGTVLLVVCFKLLDGNGDIQCDLPKIETKVSDGQYYQFERIYPSSFDPKILEYTGKATMGVSKG